MSDTPQWTGLLQLAAEPGWTPIDVPEAYRSSGSYVSGDPHGMRLRVRYFRSATEEGIVGKAWFGPGTQGPPGYAHGGSISAVLDEAMGAATWLAGHPAVAASLQVNFGRMLPLSSEARFEARVVDLDGKKVTAHARLFDVAGGQFAEAVGLFILISADRLAEFVAQAPELAVASGPGSVNGGERSER